MYCSEISKAFVKINSRRLLRKLRARGLPGTIVLAIQYWMHERRTCVAVGGKFSSDIRIHNMVHKGTVLGLPMWNIYSADAAMVINLHGFMEIVCLLRT